MKKIIIYTLSFILASSLIVPMGSLNVFASEDNTVELGDGIKIVEVTEKKIQIINDKEGTTDTIEYVDEDSAMVALREYTGNKVNIKNHVIIR